MKNINEELIKIKSIMNIPLVESFEDQEEETNDQDAEIVQHIEKSASQVDNGDSEDVKLDQSQTNLGFTIAIEAYRLRELSKGIDAMKKVCAKLRVPEPEVVVGEKYYKTVSKKAPNPLDADDFGNVSYKVELIDITIKADGSLKIPGYTLVAIVDNSVGGSILIDNNKVPSEFLQSDMHCDACGSNRMRVKSYILKDPNGDYKRFGSECVKKYTGIDPSKFLRFLNFWANFYASMVEASLGDEEDNGGGGGGRRGFSPATILVDFDQMIMSAKNWVERDGKYIKKEYEQVERRSYQFGHIEPQRTNYGQATSEKMETDFAKMKNGDQEPYQVDDQFVQAFKSFFAELPLEANGTGFQEFLAKIKDLVIDGQVRRMDSGAIGFAVSYYIKEKQKLDNPNKSDFVGTIGEKVLFSELTLTDHKSGEGQFGIWHLWTFVDPNGNVITKFGELSSKFKIDATEDDYQVNVGDKFRFISDIKKHEERNGNKSTQIGRLSTYKEPKKAKVKIDETMIDKFNKLIAY
jgi:hypothetical protein